MTTMRTAAQDAAEDLYFGQSVILWARWFVVVGAIIAALWSADTASQLSHRILVGAGLMAINLLLHGRYLVGRPANHVLLAIAGLADLAVMTAIVALWDNAGLASPYFAFFYPILFAVALVFPPLLATAYGVVGLVLYAGVCLAAGAGIETSGDLKKLMMRLITMGAAVGLGTFYWRIQRDRRRRAYARHRAVVDTGLALGESMAAPRA
jgi:hypothetical protein